jgi:hypothetical protein
MWSDSWRRVPTHFNVCSVLNKPSFVFFSFFLCLHFCPSLQKTHKPIKIQKWCPFSFTSIPSISLSISLANNFATHTHAQHLKYKHTHLEKYRQKGKTCVTFKIFSGPFFWIDTYWFEKLFLFCQSCNSLFYKPGRVFKKD